MIRTFSFLFGLTIIFLPLIRVSSNMPIYPVSLLGVSVAGYCFFKDIVSDRSVWLYFIILSLCTFIIVPNRSHVDTMDFFIFLSPIIMLFLSYSLSYISKYDKNIKFLKLMIITQLVVVIFQKMGIHIPIVNDIIEFNSVNIAQSSHWYEHNLQRPGGTISHPIWLSLSLYLYAKVIDYKTKNKIYLLLIVGITILNAARTALLIILVNEVIEWIYKIYYSKKISLVKILSIILMAPVLIYLAIDVMNSSTLFSHYIEYIKSGVSLQSILSSDYSFVYRMGVYNDLFSNASCFEYGCYTNSELKDIYEYIDSEFVHRIFMFGLLPFLILSYATIRIVISPLDTRIQKIQISLYFIVSSFTTYVFTNSYFLIVNAIFLSYFKFGFKNENSLWHK